MRSPLISLVSFFLLALLALPSVALAETGFVDVPEDFEFLQAIADLKTRGVVKGYPDQTFQPEKGVSRAEFLKMVLVSADIKKPEKLEEIGFSDVLKDDWFFEFVQTGVSKKLVKGYMDATFKPHQGVTRAEALKIIMQAYVGEDNVVMTDKNFPGDVVESDWFAKFAQLARQKWIMTDYDDGFFRPHQQLTRSLAAEVLYRSHEVFRKNLEKFDVTTEWKEFASNVGSFSLKMPRNWTVIPEVTRTIFWKMDPTKIEQDYAFISPLAGKLIVRHPVDTLAAGSAEYFESARKLSESVFGKDDIQFTEISLGNPGLSVLVEKKGIENWYIFLPNKKSLVVYSEVGESSLAPKMREVVRSMVRTIEYRPDLVSDEKQQEIEKTLSQVNANILMSGKGKETVGLLKDAIILETDDIGVGTGPVDYYFSESMNVTVKLERNSDTILAVRAGKTTRF